MERTAVISQQKRWGNNEVDQQSLTPVNTRYLRVGDETFAIYGDPESGWSLEHADLQPGPGHFRYGSIEELYFALVNLSVSPYGNV